MKHARMSNEEFFALPDERIGWHGFGLAYLKEEGEPLYADADGNLWTLQQDDSGIYRAMLT